MRNISVEAFNGKIAGEKPLEIVERKGIGHPDSICDAIMDKVSVNLCSVYLEKFGAIMHHNIDKGMLVAGSVHGAFEGGRVTSPMKLVFGDRATFRVGTTEVDVKGIAIKTAKDWMQTNLRYVDPEDIIYQVELRPGSAELTDIFKRKGQVLGSNDTSAAVGYAPMSFTEKLVLDLEKYLNSSSFKEENPVSGEDVKVMGVRKGKELQLTVAMPLIDYFVDSEKDYFLIKGELFDCMQEFVAGYVEQHAPEMSFSICFNNLDEESRGLAGIYTTVTGTSAEDADCGEVGRGNRVNGIIPLHRPVSSEAAAGKNPVSHVGKIYNLLSHRIAQKICSEVSDVAEAYVWLLSDIGVPVDNPKIAAAQVIMERGSVESVQADIKEVIDSELADILNFSMRLARGELSVC